MPPAPIVVYPPDADGARRVRLEGTVLGRAHDLYELVEMLHAAGLSAAATHLGDSDVFDWRGGGPYDWRPRGESA